MRISRVTSAMVLGLLMLAIPAASFAGVFVNISIGPPALPVYEQPPCPSAGFIWTPGYWAYGPDGYFWVPGTWVAAPQPGLLWTPGYWAFDTGGFFLFHAGYWGPHVGFYGGINYGFGYTGVGYQGGYWRGGEFNYNRTVNNVNVTNIHNVYNTTVINNNTTVNRVSYNGGTGGLTARPTSQDLVAQREQHVQPTALQTQHQQTAQSNRQLLASVNHGSPAIAATARPAEFNRGVVAARQAGAPYKPAANRAENTQSANRPMNSPQANGGVPRPGANGARPEGSTRPASAQQNGARPNVPRPSSSNGNANGNVNSRPATPEGNGMHAQNVPRPPAGSQTRSENNGASARPNNAPQQNSQPERGNTPNYQRPNTQQTQHQSMPRPPAGTQPPPEAHGNPNGSRSGGGQNNHQQNAPRESAPHPAERQPEHSR